jgi:K+/H+ antiporter YhaU regulatory subunit KhtT
MAEHGDGRLNSRLTALETDVAGLKTDVGYIRQHLDSFGRQMTDLAHVLRDKEQTDWKTVFAGLAIVISIGTLALAPMYKDLRNFRDSQRRQWDRIHDHAAIDGHRPTMIRIQALEKAVNRGREELKEEIKDVDEVVQREMRILDSAMQNRFDKEDERLQMEMDLKDTIVNEASKSRREELLGLISGLVKRVDRIEGEQARRTDRVYKHSPHP